jgi:hypothetical protein
LANLNNPVGFRPHGPVRRAVPHVSGGAVYPGDCVKMDSTGRVVVSAAAEAIYGVALEYASAAGISILVSCDPEQLYLANAHGSSISAQTNVGNVCDILATAGSSTYKVSRMEIDDSSLATGGAKQLVLVGIETRPDNALGAYVDAIVKINQHQVFGKDSFAGV